MSNDPELDVWWEMQAIKEGSFPSPDEGSMRSRIFKTVHDDGGTEMSLVHVPATPDEIVEYLRECACVDDNGIRRLPNWLDDEVFDAAADLIDNLRGKVGDA